MSEPMEYTEGDRVMYRQLDSGEWEWVFELYNDVDHRWEQILKGTADTQGYAACVAYQQALDLAVKRFLEKDE